jgi:hypothetical protein
MIPFYAMIFGALFFCSCQHRNPLSADSKIPVEFIKDDFWQVTTAIEKEVPAPF